VSRGDRIRLLISQGSPQLAYDDGMVEHLIGTASGKPAGQLPAPTGGAHVEGAWSPDGRALVIVDGQHLATIEPNAPGAREVLVGTAPSGCSYHDRV
jgi:hypothetical protein